VALVDAVRTEVARADFAAIKAKPFTGTCPTAYDGSEVTYTFAAASGSQVLPSCKYALDARHPLFVAARRLLAASDAR
jgi:hypothetical protein